MISLAMPIEEDIRTLQQIEFLAPYYRITVIGYGDGSGLPANTVWKPIDWSPNRIRKLYEMSLLIAGKIIPAAFDIYLSERPRYRQAISLAVESRADAYHACDWAALALCAQAAQIHPASIFFDGDEYWTLENESNFLWRTFFAPLIQHTMKKYTPRIDLATTLSPPFVELYQREYGLATEIMLCVPNYIEVPPKATQPDRILLVHHGAARRNRYLETMIDALGQLDNRFHLAFMLVGGDSGEDAGYLNSLRLHAETVAPGRVEFRPPVHPFEIVKAIADADIGLCFIPGSTFAYRMTLPNKLFEFMMAGLAVISGPSQEMARVVRETGAGWITEDFSAEALAATIRTLGISDIEQARKNAREAAKIMNAQVEYGKLPRLYKTLLARHS